MKKFLDVQGLNLYNQKIKNFIASSDEKSINNFKKDYFEPSVETEEREIPDFKPDTIDFAILDPTESDVTDISSKIVLDYNESASEEIEEEDAGGGGGGGDPK